MTLIRGARLGVYEIDEVIGAGGMGQVYRARDGRLARDVAVKVLPAALAANQDRIRRFEQEARAVAQLSHPGIVAVHDTGTVPPDLPDAGSPFIVFEFIDGRTLREELDQAGVSTAKAIGWTIQLAYALSAAHDKHIIHRDLKPENIALTLDGQVKILDFGLAKLTEPTASSGAEPETATGSGTILGTAAYMSPEQVRGQPADERSDIFALGLVLHEMLTGRRTFARGSPAETMSAILRDDAEPVAVAGDPLRSPALGRIVAHCLEKTPEQRFQSMLDLAFDLEALSVKGMAAATTPAVARESRSRPWLWGAAAVIVAAAGMAAWGSWKTGEPGRAGPASSGATAEAVPFLATDANEEQPAWSPAGNLIAYVSNRAGNDDIWICDPSGASPINLTAGSTGDESFPAWSPDGQRIAFLSDRDGGGIFTMTALGGDLRKVQPVKSGIAYTFSLTWSRDGSLVFTNFDANGQKQLYRADGDALSCLTCDVPGVKGAQSGDLSPSGRWLAYISPEVNARADLGVIDLTTKQHRIIAHRTANPRWSSDGTRLSFISAASGTLDLWEVNVDPRTAAPAGEPRRITSGLSAASAALSPDGRQSLVVRQRSTGHLWEFPTAAERISALTQGRQLTAGDFFDQRGRWLPDGRSIVFQSNRRGSLDIWSVPAAGGDPIRLTSAPSIEGRPRPSPDGKWIAFDFFDARGEYVHLMRPDGSGAHIVDAAWPSQFASMCCTNWSPDGSRLAVYARSLDNRNTTGLIEIDQAAGTARRTTLLDIPGGGPGYARWSPDGRWLVYEAVTEGSWDLWIASSAGRNARRLTSLPGNERQAGWSPDGRWVYFHYRAGEVWRMPVNPDASAAGPPMPWFTIARPLRAAGDSMDFSRKGDRILLSVLHESSDIWLVERAR